MDPDGATWQRQRTCEAVYADGLRDGLVDGDTMDNFPMGGDELTDHAIQKTEEALQIHSREVGEADRRRRSEC